MSDHQQQGLLCACGVPASPQMRREPSLRAAEDTLHLPTLAVFFPGKLASQLPAVTPTAWVLWMRSSVDRNNCFTNPPVFATAPMMFFSIVRSVAKQPPNPHPFNRLPDRRQKVGSVVARAATDDSRQNQVTAVIDHHRELGPPAMARSAPWATTTIEKVTTDITVFQPRSVDARLARSREQLQRPGTSQDLS